MVLRWKKLKVIHVGDIISSDGKNNLNIESRATKGLGIVSQIIDTLKTVSFGAQYVDIAATLRESQLNNGNVWYVASPRLMWRNLKKWISYC